jgi:hypothetical protein
MSEVDLAGPGLWTTSVGSFPKPDYIKQLIVDRWWGEVERLAHPLQDEVGRLFQIGQFDAACVLEVEVSQLLQQLMFERVAAEDRLRWLQLDAAPRCEGKNYPDFYEEVCGRSIGSNCGESQEFKDMQRDLIMSAIYAQLYSLTDKQLSRLLQELSSREQK